MSPWHKVDTLAERYDTGLFYMREERMPADAPRPMPTSYWPRENIQFLQAYRDWLLSGGVSELVINLYHVMMAGHVFGLTLKPHHELDPDHDLDCALEYVKAKKLTASWIKNCTNSLKHFRRFLRLSRGLGEESKLTPFDSGRVTAGLPEWLVNELDRYQRLMQRNWRPARIEQNIRRFWSGYLRMWRFFFEQRGVRKLGDLKRQHILDYIDARLSAGYAATGVNGDLRTLHTFLAFLQEEGYPVPNSLLRIPGLKLPDPLPRYLTDEQVRKLRDEVERGVQEAALASRRRLALLVRAAFYLLWQGGLRLGEVEELRLEDLDLAGKRLSVRDGKGRKDRTVYLADTAIGALAGYLAVRGDGSGDHVFLYRNAPMKKDLIRARLQDAGARVGVKVYPHRLRHTCATQLLNAGCRITSIQRFLGHKEISSTLVYARVHDQTVADDYFAAMKRVEQNLELEPRPEEPGVEVVNVQLREQLLEFARRLAQRDLCWGERLAISAQLIMMFNLPIERFASQNSHGKKLSDAVSEDQRLKKKPQAGLLGGPEPEGRTGRREARRTRMHGS